MRIHTYLYHRRGVRAIETSAPLPRLIEVFPSDPAGDAQGMLGPGAGAEEEEEKEEEEDESRSSSPP